MKIRFMRAAAALLACAVLCISALCGCGQRTADNDSRPALEVWVYSDEYKSQLERAFNEDFASAPWRVEISVVGAEELDEHLLNAERKPDIYMLSPDNLAKYTRAETAADLGELGIELSDTYYYPYTIESSTSEDGVLRAVCWQPDPGIFFYRRSIAKAYLGADDPVTVGEMLADWDSFLETARTIREQSRGKTCMTVGLEDIMTAYMSGSEQGWLSNGRLNFDDCASSFLDYAKTLADEELVYDAERWSAAWIAGIKDSQSVFGYFSSFLGMKNVLKKACGGTIDGEGSFGDWACVRGPAAYNWGGCWLAVHAEAEMPEQAAVLLDYLVGEEKAAEKNCLIDGSFSSNRAVVESIKYDAQFGEPFLGGQSACAVAAQAAPDIRMRGLTEYDSVIDIAFAECAYGYAFGGKSKETAVSDFLKTVQTAYPEIS